MRTVSVFVGVMVWVMTGESAMFAVKARRTQVARFPPSVHAGVVRTTLAPLFASRATYAFSFSASAFMGSPLAHTNTLASQDRRDWPFSSFAAADVQLTCGAGSRLPSPDDSRRGELSDRV